MGTYSIVSITRYINFYDFKEGTLNIHLQYLTLTNKINQAFTGGVLQIFTQKRTYFYLTHLMQKVSKFLLQIMIKKLLTNCFVTLKSESKSSQKLKLCTMSQKTKDQLTDTAQNIFH